MGWRIWELYRVKVYRFKSHTKGSCFLSLCKKFEKEISESSPKKPSSVPQVDYICAKFNFSSGYKQSVWSWMQKQFYELSTLLKNVYELEAYHKSSINKLSALHLLDEALNERLAVSFG